MSASTVQAQSAVRAGAGHAVIRSEWWPWAHSMITASGIASAPEVPIRSTVDPVRNSRLSNVEPRS